METFLAYCSIFQRKLLYYPFSSKQIDRMYKHNETWSEMFEKLNFPITKLSNELYLGNAIQASSYSILKENNIYYIINITNEIPNYYKNDFEYYNIPIDDTDVDISILINNFIEYIYTINETIGNVFIHCFMGCSRSVVFTIIYLVILHNYTLDSSLQWIKAHRPIINLNVSFYKQLENRFKN